MVDGAIVAFLRQVPTYRRMLLAGRPKLVSVTASVPSPLSAMPAVRVNDAKVAAAIGNHLLAGGFRNFAYCAGDPAKTIDHRKNGVQAFTRQNGYPCVFFSTASRQQPNSVSRSLVRWIAKLSTPVGIIAWNMDVARRIAQACVQLGVNVPEEVAIVAWDDDVALAESAEPTISAAVMPAERLGYTAADLLDRLLRGDPPPAQVLLIDPPAGLLHIRRSSDVSTLKDRDVWLALQYIREHSTEPLKVPQIVKHLQVSRRKLEQRFRAVVGKTLRQAIVDIRLERAKQLLLETDWPMERIADRSGLVSRQTLHNVFVAQEQMTPAQFRDRFGV